ncbi:phosphate ABC transporter permease subunit PstC [Telmatospirillum siberiense]|uniref:Phosphate transport system permease protein n=1 Tax=Telmatospirillum siberiense TaxID=382514 RepID=A0A2N3PNE6_9PROT|nr:phosphate ABC transporter permease subunit PstC [Telmatospirillum siberiense]PKU21929.1 phosphate ABC transporter permease subunit PstC [Telmatospirillum siberiense]
MQFSILLVVLLLLSAVGFRMGRGRALQVGGPKARALHSLPSYYGYYVALWCGIPAVFLIAIWLSCEPFILQGIVVGALPADAKSLPSAQLSLLMNEVRQLGSSGDYQHASGAIASTAAEQYRNLRNMSFGAMAVISLAMAILGCVLGVRYIRPDLRARNKVEGVVKIFLIASSTVAIFTTIGIVLSLLFESLRFFRMISPVDFLFGLDWSPQMAMRSDQVGSSGAFGAVPLFAGTLLISLIAMVVAVPIGLLSAIYMAEYAHPNFRSVAKPLLEVLAGIPTVVYGFFAVLTVAPFLRDAGAAVGFSIASESALATGIVMGIMIIPFISSLSDDVITAVPDSLRQGAYGLGATRSETIKQVVIPAALPGIIGGVLLAVSRAIGETMIVVMAAGLSAHLTANPFEAVTTVTVQIVTLLVGDQEFDSPKTLSAFALGLVLFLVTLVLNVVALNVVRKYREKYD